MAHEIEVNEETGKASMFYVGETPWHGLGTHFETPPQTTEEAIVAAGLDWTVVKTPLFHQAVSGSRVGGKFIKAGTMLETPGAFANIRSTDGATLGIVGSRYIPLQNREAFAAFEPFMAAGEATLETAGSLFDGRAIWILARIKRPSLVVFGDDVVDKYIVLTHGHDGFYSINFGLTPIRVVCNNTLGLSLKDKRSRFIKVRHTKNAGAALKEVSETINTADNIFEGTLEVYRRLQKIAVNAKSLDKFFKIVLKKDPKIANDDLHALTRKQFDTLHQLFEKGRGADLPGVKGTLWGAYNAATEFYNHVQGDNPSSRLARLWAPSESSNDPNPRILAAALKMAA